MGNFKRVPSIANLATLIYHKDEDFASIEDEKDLWVFVAASMDAHDGVDVVRPDNIEAGDPGRWVRRFIDKDEAGGGGGGGVGGGVHVRQSFDATTPLGAFEIEITGTTEAPEYVTFGASIFAGSQGFISSIAPEQLPVTYFVDDTTNAETIEIQITGFSTSGGAGVVQGTVVTNGLTGGNVAHVEVVAY